MDFIEFCEDVLGHSLSDWQKTYFTEMYDMVKTAKEENREIDIIMPGSRGSSRTNIHIVAIWMAHEYEEYLKGERNEQ